MVRALIIALTFAVASAAHAQQEPTVQTLLASCQAAQGTRESVACGQYIGGAGDILVLNAGLQSSVSPKDWRTIAKLAICASPTHTEMRQAFIAWAGRHSENWDDVRAIGVVKALREAWPCPTR